MLRYHEQIKLSALTVCEKQILAYLCPEGILYLAAEFSFGSESRRMIESAVADAKLIQEIIYPDLLFKSAGSISRPSVKEFHLFDHHSVFIHFKSVIILAHEMLHEFAADLFKDVRIGFKIRLNVFSALSDPFIIITVPGSGFIYYADIRCEIEYIT